MLLPLSADDSHLLHLHVYTAIIMSHSWIKTQARESVLPHGLWMIKRKFSVCNLVLISLLAGTDGPAVFSAGGLRARGEEGLSSSGTSVVTATVSTGWICDSD